MFLVKHKTILMQAKYYTRAQNVYPKTLLADFGSPIDVHFYIIYLIYKIERDFEL